MVLVVAATVTDPVVVDEEMTDGAATDQADDCGGGGR